MNSQQDPRIFPRNQPLEAAKPQARNQGNAQLIRSPQGSVRATSWPALPCGEGGGTRPSASGGHDAIPGRSCRRQVLGEQRGDVEGRGQATETRTESRAQSSPCAPPGHALWDPGHPPSSGVLSAFHLALLDTSGAIARVGEQECWPRACSPTGLPVASVATPLEQQRSWAATPVSALSPGSNSLLCPGGQHRGHTHGGRPHSSAWCFTHTLGGPSPPAAPLALSEALVLPGT